jgi:hypothetical protein
MVRSRTVGGVLSLKAGDDRRSREWAELDELRRELHCAGTPIPTMCSGVWITAGAEFRRA